MNCGLGNEHAQDIHTSHRLETHENIDQACFLFYE